MINYLSLLFNFSVVQGTPFIGLLIMAQKLQPAVFGDIRLFESLLAVIMLVSAFGLPTRGFFAGAMSHQDEDWATGLWDILRSSALISIPASVVCAVLFMLNGQYAWAAFIVIFTPVFVVNRIVIAYFQGREQHRWIAMTAGAIFTLSIAVLWERLYALEMHGWLAFRLLFELGLLASFGIFARGRLRRSRAFSGSVETGLSRAFDGLSVGVLTTAYLTIHGIAENFLIIWLGYQSAAPLLIGWAGFVQTLIALCGLLLAVSNTLLLPETARSIRAGRGMARLYPAIGLNVLVATFPCLLIYFGSDLLLESYFVRFAPIKDFLLYALISLPFRGISVACASVLLASGKLRSLIGIEVVHLVIYVALSSSFGGEFDLGILYKGIFVADMLIAAAYLAVCSRALRHRANEGQ